MYALRELERGDVPVINEWRRDRELIELLGAPYRYIGSEADEVWFESYLAHRSNTIRCAIIDDHNGDAPIGLVTLAGIDWVSRRAVLHIMIGHMSKRGKGAGTFAVGEMLRHAFEDMGLHRVELDVLADNHVARRVYERAGFKCEGIRREAAYKSGRWVDLVHMAILTEEWKWPNAETNTLVDCG